MKKAILILGLLLIVVLSGCNNTDDYLMSVDGLIVTNAITDNENVKIVIDKISNSDDDLSITIKWVNNSQEILEYGNPYKIEFYNGSAWVTVEVKENASWTLESLLVYPANNTDIDIENTHEIHTFNVSKMYELKELGKYRLTSTFNFVDETQASTATIEFELN